MFNVVLFRQSSAVQLIVKKIPDVLIFCFTNPKSRETGSHGWDSQSNLFMILSSYIAHGNKGITVILPYLMKNINHLQYITMSFVIKEGKIPLRGQSAGTMDFFTALWCQFYKIVQLRLNVHKKCMES